MARSLALAAFLLLTLLVIMAFWAAPESAAAPLQMIDEALIETNLGITTRVAVTSGAIITVTTTDDELNDDGDCSLREAIQSADTDAVVDGCPAGIGDDTIILPLGIYIRQIDVERSQLELTGTITLQGSMTGTTVLDGNNFARVLYIHPDASVTLRHLEIRNGNSGCCDSLVSGGGIANFGTLLIAYSTIQGNQAGTEVGDGGAGIGTDGGGILNAGILTITNSTISGNSAGSGYCITHGGQPTCGGPGDGGGIANVGTLMLDHATITNNQPGTASNFDLNQRYFGVGGGIANRGKTTLKNSIVATNERSDCDGRVTSLGNNIIQRVTSCTISGSYIEWGASLYPLQDNGGPTFTHALNTNSPAIDAGDCTDSTGAPVTLDQRGEPRPQEEGCDIGAYESPYTSTFTITDTNLPVIRR